MGTCEYFIHRPKDKYIQVSKDILMKVGPETLHPICYWDHVLNKEEGYNFYQCVSPDGMVLAWVQRQNGIWKCNIGGGNCGTDYGFVTLDAAKKKIAESLTIKGDTK
jgi:hypothetical protein